MHAESLFATQAPWLHYIPVKASYEDLYDIMAFFAGPVKADGQIDESLGHDVSLATTYLPTAT